MIFISSDKGFTLVEIAIVMIIIGLLIGGTFGGLKLVENMQINRTVQDLKAIESAALTFKDTYGRLPGDIRNPATRLPSCTDAPCATGGDGNRQVGVSNWVNPMAATDEVFTFWHHLRAADLLSMDYSNTLSMEFGEGQPSNPIGGGYRINNWGPSRGLGPCPTTVRDGGMFMTGEAFGNAPNGANAAAVSCNGIGSADRKLDDGQPNTGFLISNGSCTSGFTCTANYVATPNNGIAFYDFRGF